MDIGWAVDREKGLPWARLEIVSHRLAIVAYRLRRRATGLAKANVARKGGRPSSCAHDGGLYRLALFAVQEPAGHFTFEGGETEVAPALFGGRTGEFCFTGPPTAFCFVGGGPPTELCAKAGG
jgi:hypothetical protein